MKKFIISDLDGDGVIYDSIMGYLENVSLVDDVELYINGDLMDRGYDGWRVLNDVIERINGKGNVKINYLGGTHELMMHRALKERKPGKWINLWSDWMQNGGWVIEAELDALEENAEEVCDFYKDFMGNLDVYKKFDEKINGNNILLVHASSPNEVLDKCQLKIKDDTKEVEDIVYKREWIEGGIFFSTPIGENDLSKEGYFIIKGHTIVDDERGFIYNKDQNYLNIDGGIAKYFNGEFNYDHIPLVEVQDGKLNILVFNHNNQIVGGYNFDGEIKPMDDLELEVNREFIDHRYDNCREKQKQLIKEINNFD